MIWQHWSRWTKASWNQWSRQDKYGMHHRPGSDIYPSMKINWVVLEKGSWKPPRELWRFQRLWCRWKWERQV